METRWKEVSKKFCGAFCTFVGIDPEMAAALAFSSLDIVDIIITDSRFRDPILDYKYQIINRV